MSTLSLNDNFNYEVDKNMQELWTMIRVVQSFAMNSHTRPTPQIQTGDTTLSSNISSFLERSRSMISALSESFNQLNSNEKLIESVNKENPMLFFAFRKKYVKTKERVKYEKL